MVIVWDLTTLVLSRQVILLHKERTELYRINSRFDDRVSFMLRVPIDSLDSERTP